MIQKKEMKLRNVKIANIAGIMGMSLIFAMVFWWVTSGNSRTFDLNIMEYVYANRTPALNTLFEMITYAGEWFTVIAICLLLLAFDKTRMTYGVPVAIITTASFVINYIFKIIVERTRPLQEMMLIEQGGFSFPSGHSATGFATYIMLAYLLLKYMNSENLQQDACKERCYDNKSQSCHKSLFYAICLAVLAILIGVSRVYLGVHYPTDVIGGFVESSILLLVMIGFVIPALAKQRTRPKLLVMAAGMGSRYGGLKQIDPVTKEGEIIIDFSLYDAMKAGFRDVVFVIRKENEKDFRELIDNKAGRKLNITYVYQDIDDLPKGFKVPDGRTKPWGTGHAILSARHVVNGAFAVINGDDYYGPSAFASIFEYLSKAKDKEKYDFCMVGYKLKNTLTDNGYVSRGVCTISEEGTLENIEERTKIKKGENSPAYTEDDGETWIEIDEESVVSMNLLGYTKSMMDELNQTFPEFLRDALENNPLKGEFLIPKVTGQLIVDGKAEVKMLSSKEKWFGVTYKEDKEYVSKSIEDLKKKGVYPKVLWE